MNILKNTKHTKNHKRLKYAKYAKYTKYLTYILLMFSLIACSNLSNIANFGSNTTNNKSNASQNKVYALVNVAVAGIYDEITPTSPLSSQAIYASQVEVLQQKGNWLWIKSADGYLGLMKKNDVVFTDDASFFNTQRIVKTNNLFTNIYRNTSVSNYAPMITVPYGTILPMVETTKFAEEYWVKVKLVDGSLGYIKQAELIIDPPPLTVNEAIDWGKRLVGIPYLWGGTSSYGIDCSGFVQLFYKQMDINIPRDANMQVDWKNFVEVKSQKDLQAGDAIYFGFDGKISHSGIYIGNNQVMHATVRENPILHISDLRLPLWQNLYIVARHYQPITPPEFSGKVSDIPPQIQERMEKYSWHQGCPVAIKDLAYLQLSYWGFDNQPHLGEMVVNKNVAEEVMDIFKYLYENKYPINKIRLIDDYQGDDDASMLDNNTSAFNCRTMTDFPDMYSVHSYGRAIDINPLINPYVNKGQVTPKESEKYLDRSVYQRGKIKAKGIVHDIFAQHGWSWGGDWQGDIKDYQHFEK